MQTQQFVEEAQVTLGRPQATLEYAAAQQAMPQYANTQATAVEYAAAPQAKPQ
jgi:hypothetical protein